MKYVIADIHGESEKLRSLLDLLSKDASEYIFLGDYVDKGADAKGTIELLIELSKTKKCTFLMGDHEYAWKEYLAGNDRFIEFLLKYGGIQTLESYLGRKFDLTEATNFLTDRDAVRNIFVTHRNFFLNLKYYFDVDEKFICVHGGINPDNKDVPMELHNIEEMLFIRSKFINSKFFYKENKRMIFGHTAFENPYIDEYKIGIDLGAVYGSQTKLNSLNIDEMYFIDNFGRKTLADQYSYSKVLQLLPKGE